jgi:hypothetical protein
MGKYVTQLIACLKIAVNYSHCLDTYKFLEDFSFPLSVI